ncbi:MAG: DUF1707 domain-containing protein [Actinomycetota bacterium]|nr:DUF1707 domain-containing protein [Actinomycetota bacterium]MDA8208640.1 DUF1707 domain-containing protein [Actinomycetota bacterium]
MADEMYLRAGDSDRERVTAFLSGSLEHGYIDTNELAERLDKLNASKTYADLLPLVQDIPGGKQVVREISARHRRTEPGLVSPVGPAAPVVRRPRHRGRVALIALAVFFLLPALGGMASMTANMVFGTLLSIAVQVAAVGFLVWLVLAVARPRRRRF